MTTPDTEDTPLLANPRQIGPFSATFVIFNRIVGAGIFATPSTILRFSGSVGLSLLIWIIGGAATAAGMYVYIVWGSVNRRFPRNGAEKNYLEFLFQKPAFLVTCIFGAQSILLIWAAGSAQIFAQYLLNSLDVPLTPSWPVKIAAFASVLFATVIHGTSLKWGLRLQNALGVLKITVLCFVVVTGWVAASGKLRSGVEPPRNFDHAFEGTSHSPSSICFALYNVIYSFHGYSNANYALGETKNPARTIRIAGFSALLLVTGFYVLVILSYLFGVSKEDIVRFGSACSRTFVSECVSSSDATRFISMCCFTFAQGRVNQALGREGSSKPYGAPFAGMTLHCLMCFLIIFLLPAGQSYPWTIINTLISLGLLSFLWQSKTTIASSKPNPFADYRSPGLVLASVFFVAVNIFLMVVPLTPPPPGGQPYEYLPYWLHSIAAWVVMGLGVLYWAFGWVLLPRIKNYRLVAEKEIGEDGEMRTRFVKVPNVHREE
ncbi:high affinity methionine permease [Flagelloscypha sp. PMI_526]|nr:high affinity methionine permease [Flagelloscypha sp. PMI_526]